MAVQDLAGLLFDCEVRDANIVFTSFGKAIKTLPFDRIESVREISFRQTLVPDFRTWRLGNRLFKPRIIEITTKGRFLNRILVTPKHADEFLHAWQSYLESS